MFGEAAMVGSNPLPLGNGEEARMKEAFHTLMLASTQESVSPFACIPLACIRDVTEHGVKRLMRSYLEGPAALTAQPLVVKLEGDRAPRIQEYLRRVLSGDVESQMAEEIGRYESWYGVIDGMHRLTALQRLSKVDSKFHGFMVSVRVVPGKITDREVSQAARANNDLNSSEHKVEGTIYDQLKGFHEEHNRLRALNGKALATHDVAEAYTGMSLAKRSSYIQRARVALALSREAVDAIGSVVNYVKPNHAGPNADNEVSSEDDPRVYRRTISFNMLKAAGRKLVSESATVQASALHRVLTFCDENRRTSISASDFANLIEGSKLAVREIEKFCNLLGNRQEWPSGMGYLKEQLLRSHNLDEACKSNVGNARLILPQIRSKYLAICPLIAGPRLNAYERGEDHDAYNPNPFITDSGHSNEEAPVELPGFDLVAEAGEDDVEIGVDPPVIASPVEDPDAELKDLGVEAWCSRWQDFRSTESRCTSLVGETDMVLTDLPYNLKASSRSRQEPWDFIDDQGIRDVAQFARKLLKPGRYAVIFCGFRSVSLLMDELGSSGFQVSSVPCVAVKAQKEVAKRAKKRPILPQSSCEFFVVALLPPDAGGPGRHMIPEKPYEYLQPAALECSRRLSVITGIPTMERKLKGRDSPTGRKFVRGCEKPVKLLRELVETYCPRDGLVVDLYAGTYTTGIACLQTGRPCVMIEMDQECHQRAIKRLRTMASLVERGKADESRPCSSKDVAEALKDDEASTSCDTQTESECSLPATSGSPRKDCAVEAEGVEIGEGCASQPPDDGLVIRDMGGDAEVENGQARRSRSTNARAKSKTKRNASKYLSSDSEESGVSGS